MTATTGAVLIFQVVLILAARWVAMLGALDLLVGWQKAENGAGKHFKAAHTNGDTMLASKISNGCRTETVCQALLCDWSNSIDAVGCSLKK